MSLWRAYHKTEIASSSFHRAYRLQSTENKESCPSGPARNSAGIAFAQLACARPPVLERLMDAQRTLRRPISCVGIGLHSGNKVNLALKPAPADFGIRFRRTDLGDHDVPATVQHL